jgi:hypothetical protein
LKYNLLLYVNLKEKAMEAARFARFTARLRALAFVYVLV